MPEPVDGAAPGRDAAPARDALASGEAPASADATGRQDRPASVPVLPRAWAGARVVLVHDWLTGMRGGEKVLESLCRLFPDAPLVTLVHARGSVSPLIERRRIRTSVVQMLPRATRWYRHYLPLFPAAVELLDLDDADLVISTSHCAAKAVIRSGRAFHVCYCHSPMRYAWDQFEAYFGPARVGARRSAVMRRLMAGLARWDRSTAHRVDRFLANSQYVAARIARYYNRAATVLHPPVDTQFFTPGGFREGASLASDLSARQARGGGAPRELLSEDEPFFLVVSALVPYKRIDLAVAAAARLGVPLKIAGDGPDRARLAARAGTTAEWLGPVDDDTLRRLYRRAQAVVLPGEEDFGIVPVEAMACGRPVVALGRGGACETVADGQTGVLVPELTVEALAHGLDRARRTAFDPARLRSQAERFSVARFEAAFTSWLQEALPSAAC
jgi:glycosyltransferase involved in cell wall biosynthesis